MSKFLDGLKFGLGFGLALLATLYLGLGYVLNRGLGYPDTTEVLTYAPPIPDPVSEAISENVDEVPFHELDLEGQIKQSTAIAFAEFRLAEDGKNLAIITEFPKRAEGIEIGYEVGEEHGPSSFYPRDDVGRGDGVVIFFTGSPAKIRMSTTYHGDRISGLGDIPMQLFRDKCEQSDT